VYQQGPGDEQDLNPMLRPLTLAAVLSACGSGLYLYQSKHEVQVLDMTIKQTVHDTRALRQQSRRLATEWTMLNDPERLRQLADMFLNLRPILPAQFISLADLDGRLPLSPAEASRHGQDDETDVPITADLISPTAVPVSAGPTPGVRRR